MKKIILSALLSCTSLPLIAQTGVSINEAASDRLSSSSVTATLGDDLFGESVSLYTGATEFRHSDLSIPGNSSLPVSVNRLFTADTNRILVDSGDPGFGARYHLGDWELDLPYMSGTFAASQGWIVAGANPYARCSVNDLAPPPYIVGSTLWNFIEFYDGLKLYTPGTGQQPVIKRSAPDGIPLPAGGIANLTAKNNWRFQCLPSIKSSQGGEGFIAIAPDGTKYYFDWMVSFTERPLRKVKSWVQPRRPGTGLLDLLWVERTVHLTDPITGQRTGESTRSIDSIQTQPSLSINPAAIIEQLALQQIRLYPSKIEDRHGNTVTYTWNGRNLTSISGNDGRVINLTYVGNRLNSASAGTQTVQYIYNTNGTLASTVLPDNSKWTFNFSAIHSARRYANFIGNERTSQNYDMIFQCAPMRKRIGTNSAITITHPSGATGQFNFALQRHTRTNVSYDHCAEPVYVGNNIAAWLHFQSTLPESNDVQFDSRVAIQSDVLALQTKKITGVGLGSVDWTYAYQDIWQNGTAPGEPINGTRKVTVTQPDGSKREMVFGTHFDLNEGQLLNTRMLKANVVEATTNYRYASPIEAQTLGLPELMGYPETVEIFEHRNLPVLQTDHVQDAVTFSSKNNLFDTLTLNPTNISKFSSLGNARNEIISYEHNLTKWVLGQVKTVTNVNTNKIVSQTNYDAATALPLQRFSFGLLQNTMSYNSDGTLATVKDAKNNTVTLSNYKRGIPQNVSFADGTGISAVVNDSGWVTSVADQLGSTTSYEYDLMGRLRKTLYPVGDTNAWQPTNTWFRQQANGVWANSVWDDRYAKATQYDAMWRPTLQTEWDWADGPGTQRQTSWRYDTQGRVAFQSYPYKTTTDVNTLPGIHTEYDALGRVTKVKQDSELGQLTTTTEYLAGFQTKVTNPKGVVTRQGYQVFDAPDTSRPVFTVYAEGTAESKISDVIRDVFGKATYTQMRNPSSSQYFGRSYVFDVNERLCKTVVPEAGATHYEYDANNNVIRMAEGDHTYTTRACDAGNIALANKTVTTYDAMNRVTNVDVPGGANGDKSYLYEADGLVKQINTVSNSAPIVNRYFYNKRRMLVNEQSEQTGWYNWGVGYDYNNNAALSRTTYPTGFYVDYAPNGLGQATQAASVHGNWANAVQYYPNGAVKQFTYGNGIVHTMTQNARQLPISSRDALGNTAIIHFDTTFDANGNVINYSDPGQGGRNNRAMQYDALDRLTQVYAPNLWGFANYQYDGIDNLKRSTLGLAGFTYNYDANNRLSRVDRDGGGSSFTYAYDVKGNVTNNGRNVFTYDGANRMYDAAGVEGYRYDGNNRRVLAWAPVGGSILSMYGQSGQLFFQSNGRETKNYEYIFLGDDLVASREYNWTIPELKTKYQHTDALGSPVATTDEAGNVVERTEYAPYGAPLNRPLSGVGYTGHVMDQNTGLVYAQQRYYDPMLGRFLSPDPVETNPNNGVNFNRYKYALNNPYRYTDPDGRCESISTCQMARDDIDLAEGRMSREEHMDRIEARGAGAIAGIAALIVSRIAPTALPVIGKIILRQAGQQSKELPKKPSDMTKQGYKETTHPKAGEKGHRTFENAKTGDKVRHDQGKPGKPGHEGKDHYHRENPNATGKQDQYLDKSGNPTPRGSDASHLYPKEKL